MPTGLFYPFYPEHNSSGSAMVPASNGNNGDYGPLLAEPIGAYGYQQSENSFIIEEKDPAAPPTGITAWMNGVSVLVILPQCCDSVVVPHRSNPSIRLAGLCKSGRSSHQ